MRALLALVVCAGLALRVIEAARKSLWLDELHSLHIAWGATLGDVVERVQKDLHPPLYFATLHAFRELDPHVLRGWSILLSLLTVPFLLAIARAAGLSPLARLTAAALFASAPYQVQYGCELRSYAALQLASVVLVWAAFTSERGARTRFLAFAAATGIGLWHHYYTALAVVAVLAARLPLFPWSRSSGLLRWRTLAFAGFLGVLAFLPWILGVESWLVTDIGRLWRSEKLDTAQGTNPTNYLGTGFFDQDFSKAWVIGLRTYVPMIGSLGPHVAGVARAAAGAFFALILAGACNLGWRSLRKPRGSDAGPSPVLLGVLLAGASAYAIALFLCLFFWRRVPEQYFVIGAWVWPIFGAALVDALPNRKLAATFATALALASFALGTCHALGRSREDVRAGVRLALELGEPRHALYTALLWQPTWYPHALPFQAYAPGADFREPADIPPADAAGGDRPVVVVTRRMPYDGWDTIRAGRELESSVQLDDVTWVQVYTPR